MRFLRNLKNKRVYQRIKIFRCRCNRTRRYPLRGSPIIRIKIFNTLASHSSNNNSLLNSLILEICLSRTHLWSNSKATNRRRIPSKRLRIQGIQRTRTRMVSLQMAMVTTIPICRPRNNSCSSSILRSSSNISLRTCFSWPSRWTSSSSSSNCSKTKCSKARAEAQEGSKWQHYLWVSRRRAHSRPAGTRNVIITYKARLQRAREARRVLKPIKTSE